MALWIDDLLPDQDKYLDLSFRARACLVEIWCFAKRSKSDGVVKVQRLHRASDAFSPEVMAELIDNNWWHEGGRGCGTESCPRGIDGYVVLHDFVDHQESAKAQSQRIQKAREKKREDAARRAEWNATHTAIRDDKGRITGWKENPQ